MSAAVTSAGLLLDVTVPVLTGTLGMVARGLLGMSDFGALLRGAAVGDPQRDPRHETVRIRLDPGQGVGGHTKLGLLEFANDDGRVRVTVPGPWASVLARRGWETQRSTDEGGRVVARVWLDPRPGQEVVVPLPGLPDRRLAVGFAGWA